MFLAFGIVCALLEARASGHGQVVDAAMVDGAAVLMAFFHGFRAMGIWDDQRGTNMLDTGAHYYDVYETADGKYISIGSIEPQFYAELLERLGLDADELPAQNDKVQWPALKERFATVFRAKTRDRVGASFSKAPTCASPRSCRWRRLHCIRTTSPGGPSPR